MTEVLRLAEYKNGRNMQNLNIVIDRRKIGTSFTFQGFRKEKANCFFVNFFLIEWQLLLLKTDFRLILFSIFRAQIFSRMRIAPINVRTIN